MDQRVAADYEFAEWYALPVREKRAVLRRDPMSPVPLASPLPKRVVAWYEHLPRVGERGLRPPFRWKRTPRVSRNTERDAEILRLMSTPARFLSLDRLGQHYGVTRERMRQLIARLGIEKPFGALGKPCPGCGGRRSYARLSMLCDECFAAKHAPFETTCGWCGVALAIPRHAYNAGQQPNPLRKSPQSQWFCDKTCQGKHLAKTVGWQRKYSDEQFMAVVKAPAKRLRLVAAEHNVPIETAYGMRSNPVYAARRAALS